MDWGGWVKLVHVVAAGLMTAGIVGRAITYTRARRANDLQSVRMLLEVAELFDTRFVIPGSSVLLLFGLLTAWLRGWPILGFLQGEETNWVLVSLLLTLTIAPVILYLMRPQVVARKAALEEAIALDAVTPALTAALNSRSLQMARVYEMVMVAVVTALMVLKPF